MDPAEKPQVILSEELRSVYYLAKEAYISYEQFSLSWDVNAITRFRDALDHIMAASDTSVDVTRQARYLAQAIEHLSEVIAEPWKSATLDQLVEAEKLRKRIRLARPFLSGISELQSTAQDLHDSASNKMVRARSLQGRTDLQSIKDMHGLFLGAFQDAQQLVTMLQILNISWNRWLSIGWGGLTVSGIVGTIVFGTLALNN